MTDSMLDGLIYVAIVLFILSVIVEKITQLIRQYPWQTKWITLILLLSLETLLITTYYYKVVEENLVLTGLILLINIVFVFLLVAFSSKFRSEHNWGKSTIIPLIGFLVVFLLVISWKQPGSNPKIWDWGVLLLINTAGLFLTIMNLPDVRKKFTWAATDMAVLKNISKNAAEPDLKEKEVTFLSFITGFFIAYAFKANLIEMFLHPNKDALGWGNAKLLSESWVLDSEVFLLSPYQYFGFGLTGFFLAFGSKFFHDLLDTLLQVKELKRKLNDKETYQPDNIKQFDQFLSTDYNELVRICIEQNQPLISALPSLASYYIGLSSDPIKRRPVIVLHSTLQQNAGYPPSFQGKLDSGKLFTIETEVIYNFKTPDIHLEAGDGVNHSSYANKPGTICCSVKDAKHQYLLTCAHVMTGGAAVVNVQNNNGWIVAPTPQDSESPDLNFASIGDWTFGMIDNELDVALVASTTLVAPIINLNVPPADYTTELNGEQIFVNGKLNKTQAYIRGFVNEGGIL